ncbi:unnamed protein product [Nezara viridula]|uniref:Uncharacterized protein n=1 Tax=Nezara viridula TaxID=85310 RepID=A0A9P0HS66_NEZVI|nr:unnamed protein product [Nezara viridula]
MHYRNRSRQLAEGRSSKDRCLSGAILSMIREYRGSGLAGQSVPNSRESRSVRSVSSSAKDNRSIWSNEEEIWVGYRNTIGSKGGCDKIIWR